MKTKFGIYVISNMIAIAGRQGVKINNSQAIEILKIESICDENRLLKPRFEQLAKNGYSVTENPMNTGEGVGRCVKKVNGLLRVRVSANWSGGNANYSHNVHIK